MCIYTHDSGRGRKGVGSGLLIEPGIPDGFFAARSLSESLGSTDQPSVNPASSGKTQLQAESAIPTTITLIQLLLSEGQGPIPKGQ